jgi:thiamine-phosphate pyrophosphorylase
MLIMKGYYFITDGSLSKMGNLHDVQQAVSAGVKIVQYRNKFGLTLELMEEAVKLREICKDILFIVNDRLDVALASGADGVHIGMEDEPYEAARKLFGKKGIIGMTVHNALEALEAESLGADYVGASPIFATGTKSDAGAPSGIKLITEIKKVLKIPVVAIGGITLENAPEVVKAGADALCAISAVVAREDVAGEIRKFQDLYERM